MFWYAEVLTVTAAWDVTGTCDLYTFQTPTQLHFHLNRVWCHCLLSQLLKRTITGTVNSTTTSSRLSASPRDQVRSLSTGG